MSSNSQQSTISRRQLLAAFGAAGVAMASGGWGADRVFAAESAPSDRTASGTMEAFNVKQYGAVGDGKSDDSAAFQRVVHEISAIGKGVLYIPRGDYRIDTIISKRQESLSMSVVGDGQGLTNLLGNNADGIFQFVHSKRSPQITIRDLSLIAIRPNAGTAIEVKQPEGGNQHNRTLIINNVQIFSNDPQTDYFQYGVQSIGQYRPQFWNVSVSGCSGSDAARSVADDSPLFRGACGIQANGSYAPSFQHCQVWSMQLGYSIVSEKRPGPEGCFMYRSSAVDCRVGVDVGTAGIEPGLAIDACYFRCRDVGLRLKRKYFSVTNSMFMDIGAGKDSPPYTDISLTNSDGAIVTGNIFEEDDSAERTMVQLEGKCSNISIKDNLFRAKGVAMSIGPQSKEITCINNQFNAQATRLMDTKSDGVSFATHEFRGALLYCSKEQSVPEGEWVDIAWDTAEYDTNRFLNTPGGVVIPPGLGIQYVRLTANFTWPDGNQGWKQAEFTKNGNPLFDSGTSEGPGTSVAALNFESPIIPVQDGDVLQVRVRQNTGNALQIKHGPDTWFAVEAVNG
jgi:hypothetical protein